MKKNKQERRDLKRTAKYDRQDIKQKTKKVKRLLHSKIRR
ncbi:unnamed protein product, partial [marine sediment metagenome]